MGVLRFLLFHELQISEGVQWERVLLKSETLRDERGNRIGLYLDQFTSVDFNIRFSHSVLWRFHQNRERGLLPKISQILPDYYKTHQDLAFAQVHIHDIYILQFAFRILLYSQKYKMEVREILRLFLLHRGLFLLDKSDSPHPGSLS